MTDQTDDGRPSRAELEDRVEQLEQTVSAMLPSRRDALKLGGTALAAGGLGSALTGSASAGSASVGTVGTSSDPVDIEAEDINPSGTRDIELGSNIAAGGNDINNVGSIDTDELDVTNVLKTAADDSELDGLSLSDGDKLFLGSTDFSDSRTITTRLDITGSSCGADGTRVSGQWTINARHGAISNLLITADMTIQSAVQTVSDIDISNGITLLIDADDVTITNVGFGGTVKFAGSTQDGEVGVVGGKVSVVDNGSNSIL